MHTNFWTSVGATTISSNATHTRCSFNYLSTYAVLEKSEEATSYDLLAIIIGSAITSLLLIGMITISIVCFKRRKVSECCCAPKCSKLTVCTFFALFRFFTTLTNPVLFISFRAVTHALPGIAGHAARLAAWLGVEPSARTISTRPCPTPPHCTMQDCIPPTPHSSPPVSTQYRRL